jgi:hypothetical protein
MCEALTTDADPVAIAAAREHSRTFSWERTASETLRVYEEAMAAR